MYKRISQTIFFIGVIVFSAFDIISAQENFSVNLESKAHYGFIVPHRTGVKNLILGHVKAFELNYDIPTFGDKKWEQLYNYPTWGFSFYYADLANPQQLGNAAGIYPYINFSSIKTKKFQLNYHMGWGFGYVSKSFDRKENYKNIVIGSKFNSIVGLGCEAEWKISPRFSTNAGISLTHFSNGAYQVPNLGINIPTINAGFSFLTGDITKEFKRDTIISVRKKYEISIAAAGGIKEIYPVGGKKYPAFTFTVNIAKTLSPKNQLAAGIDVFYNSSILKFYERKGTSLSKQEIIQSGLILFYIADVHKVSIIAGMGAYVYSRYVSDGTFYHRVGMRYRLTDNLFANITLKSHFFKADFSEWGIGYKF